MLKQFVVHLQIVSAAKQLIQLHVKKSTPVILCRSAIHQSLFGFRLWFLCNRRGRGPRISVFWFSLSFGCAIYSRCSFFAVKCRLIARGLRLSTCTQKKYINDQHNGRTPPKKLSNICTHTYSYSIYMTQLSAAFF